MSSKTTKTTSKGKQMMVEPRPTSEDLDNNSVTEITQALNKNPQVNTAAESKKNPSSC